MSSEDYFTLSEKKAITIVPIITGSLSIIGSSLIIYMTLFKGCKSKTCSQRNRHSHGNVNSDKCLEDSDFRSQGSVDELSEPNASSNSVKRQNSGGDRKNSVYYRLMMGMSVLDILHSTNQACSVFPMPSETPHVYGAMGNQTTCNISGFFGIIGCAVPMYNCALSMYYVLTIKYNMEESTLRRKVEPFFHLISIGYPLSLAIAASIYDLYGSHSVYNCQIAAKIENGTSPLDQTDSDDDPGTNLRGKFLLIAIATAAILIVLVLGCMLAVIQCVFKQSKAILKQNKNLKTNSVYFHRARNIAVAKQALLYALFFFLTLFFTIIEEIGYMILKRPVFALTLLTRIFYPFQGFFNYFVFIRPRAIQIQQKYKESFLSAMYNATFHFNTGINQQMAPKRLYKDNQNVSQSCDSDAAAYHKNSQYYLPTITEDSSGTFTGLKDDVGQKYIDCIYNNNINTLHASNLPKKSFEDKYDEIKTSDDIEDEEDHHIQVKINVK